MKWYKLDPDVPGRLEETRREIRENPDISTIHYIFECWPDDDIVQAHPVIIVSAILAEMLEQAKLTGFELRNCESSKGEQFEVASPNCGSLPKFHWLYVKGQEKKDDFFYSDDLMLTVSERAFSILKTASIANCDIEEL